MNGARRGRTPIFHLTRCEVLSSDLENSGSDPVVRSTQPKEPRKEIGGSYRIRTYDQLVKSQLLYQLS